MAEMVCTIISGVLVFVACEWLKEIWLSPLQEYKKLKAKVSKALIVHAQYYGNPISSASQKNEEYSHASSEMRNVASELLAFAEIMPFLHLGMPNARKIVQAGSQLIGLSNSFYVENEETRYDHIAHNHERCNRIKSLLGLQKMPESQ